MLSLHTLVGNSTTSNDLSIVRAWLGFSYFHLFAVYQKDASATATLRIVTRQADGVFAFG